MMATEQVRIQDRQTVWEWDGELIHKVTTRRNEALRWVELELWELAGGGILIHRVGESVVYHTAGTRCTGRTGRQHGDPGKVDDLRDDAEPCEFCQPPWPEDLGDAEPIRIEYPRHEINKCQNGGEAIVRLTTSRRRGNTTDTVIWSEPVKELIAEATAKRPDLFPVMTTRIE